MTEPKEIRTVPPGTEFRACPACGYALGFHVSFLAVVPAEGNGVLKTTKETYRLILICPECGARYDIRWKVSFGE